MGISKRIFFPILTALSAILSVTIFSLPVLGSETTAVETTTQMNVWQAIVLGFVQGATEFIPISSTAHLKAVPVLLGWGDPGVAFSAMIQLGSIGAVLWYFWGLLTEVIGGAFVALKHSDYQDNNFKIAVGIAVGTIPIVFFGLLIKVFFEDFYENSVRSMTMIACASILMSVLMGLAEKLGSRKRNFDKLSAKDGILMGFGQLLAIVPGASRSGSTITTGLFMGLERETAAKFSFLLGIPAITLPGIVGLKDLLEADLGNMSVLMPSIAGLISSAIFSYLAIAWLLNFLKTRSNWIFVWYRLVFGIAILGLISTGILQNI
ncbi:MAG: undecaprenyl-diphosphate phosphatase [Cyanobacteria bacterium J06639_18]